MTWFNQYYAWCGRMEFRRVFKRDYYAYMYSSAAANKQFRDFCRMYDMGNEL